LTSIEILELLKIVKFGQRIIGKKFSPDWFNVQQNGNWIRHIHVLIIPRYKNQVKFNGKIFIDKSFRNPVKFSKHPSNKNLLTKLVKNLFQ
jgi:diadenosine tetraphosphate (Ap4A) HIT family hydrolase